MGMAFPGGLDDQIGVLPGQVEEPAVAGNGVPQSLNFVRGDVAHVIAAVLPDLMVEVASALHGA